MTVFYNDTDPFAMRWLMRLGARGLVPWGVGVANSLPGVRMGRLRGYDNAIVPQVAAEFVRASMDMKGY